MFTEGKDKAIKKFTEWALVIFMALFPFIFYIKYLYYGTASRSVNLVIVAEVLAVIIGCALLSRERRLKIAKSPITIALLAFLVVLVVSAFAGVDLHTSFWSRATRMTGIFYFLHIGFFYLCLMMVFQSDKKRDLLIKTFLISAAVFSIGALLARDGLGLIFAEKPWQGFTFGNSSFAAMYLYAAFMLSFYYVFSLEGVQRWWHKLLPLVYIINPFFINKDLWLGKINVLDDPLTVLGGAQASAVTAIVSVFGLLAIYLISKIKSSKIRIGTFITVAIVGVTIFTGAVYSFLTPGQFIHEAYLSQETPARPIVWELSKESISQKPLLGWGTDNFDRAFEASYDNRLLEQKNGAEPWFDRAHNIFIDQTVESGYVGLIAYLLVYLAIIVSMGYVMWKSSDRKNQALAAVITVYFFGHLLELQTAFDTSISYIAVVFMAALGAFLFHKVYEENKKEKSVISLHPVLSRVAGAVMIAGFGYLFVVGTVPIVKAEKANGYVHDIGSSEKRLERYPALFGSPVDPASFLWRTVSDFQRGIAEKPEVLEDPKKRESFLKEAEFFASESEKYLARRPDDFRMHLTLANIYIYQKLLGVDNLEKAHEVLDRAEILVPKFPQTHWMKAVAYLYQAKFKLARDSAREAYDLNPGVEQSRKMIDYIEKSTNTFPDITFYNFLQI